MKAIRFEKTGGPEVLHLEKHRTAAPRPAKCGFNTRPSVVNFIDTYHRCGLYPVPLPSGLGLEAAGTVEVLGDGVANLKIGDRCCLLLRSHRRLCRSQQCSCRSRRKDSRRSFRRGRRGGAAQGTDRALSPETYLSSAARPDNSRSFRGWWRGTYRLPMGEASGRDGNRYSWFRRQGCARKREWLRACSQPEDRRLEQTRARAHRRKRRARCL